MRITDLLKRESVELNGSVSNKQETIEKMEQVLEQMKQLHKEEYRKVFETSEMLKNIKTGYFKEKKKEPPELVKELPFLMQKQMQ